MARSLATLRLGRELLSAWRARADSPLVELWLRADLARQRRLPFHKRGQTLIWAALPLSLLYSAFVLWVLFDLLAASGSGVITRGWYMQALRGCVAALWYPLCLLALGWLISAVQRNVEFAMGLLADSSGTRSRGLDDMLAGSQLRDSEILLSALAYGMRKLGAPLLLLSVCEAMLVYDARTLGAQTLLGSLLSIRASDDLLAALLSALWTASAAFSAGLFVGLMLMLLYIPLGRGAAGGLPSIAAVVQMLAQIFGLYWVVFWHKSLEYPPPTTFNSLEDLAGLLTAVLVPALAVWLPAWGLYRLAEQHAPVRVWLAIGLPLLQMVASFVLLLLWLRQLASSAAVVDIVATGISVISSMLFSTVPGLFSVAAMNAKLSAALVIQSMIIGMQVALFLLGLGASLKAIALRRRGAA